MRWWVRGIRGMAEVFGEWLDVSQLTSFKVYRFILHNSGANVYSFYTILQERDPGTGLTWCPELFPSVLNFFYRV